MWQTLQKSSQKEPVPSLRLQEPLMWLLMRIIRMQLETVIP